MSTQDFYERFKDEINSFRKDLKASGLNSYEANKIIAMHFYGSQ